MRAEGGSIPHGFQKILILPFLSPIRWKCWKRSQSAPILLPICAASSRTRRNLRLCHKLIESQGKAGNGGNGQRILLNMERWRWLPDDLGSLYVMVNVPEFTLRVVEDGKVIHTARVVVGKPDKQTPIFRQDMQEIVFNPYWNVPNSIKTEELLP